MSFNHVLSNSKGYTVLLCPRLPPSLFFLKQNYALVYFFFPRNVNYHKYTIFLDVIQSSSHRTISCSKLLKNFKWLYYRYAQSQQISDLFVRKKTL